MNTLLKTLLCLLVTAALAAGFITLYWIDFFGVIETEFYAPRISGIIKKKLSSEAAVIETYFNELNERFAATLTEQAVSSAFAVQQSSIDIYERGRIFGELQAALPALQWVRLIDTGGNRIHFSTETADLSIRSGSTAAYRAWTEVPRYLRLTQPMLNGNGGIFLDSDNDRCIFYLPCYDEYHIRRGIALFSMPAQSIAEQLHLQGITAPGTHIALVTEPKGVIAGLREAADDTLKESIAALWKEGVTERVRLSSAQYSFFLFTQKTAQNILVGFLASEQNFTLPFFLKILTAAVLAITVYILLFWFMNLKQDAVTIVQNRVKRLQMNLLREYFELKDDMDWRQWKHDIASRREEARRELLRGFTEKKQGSAYQYVNSFFDKSWDELVSVISSRSKSDNERLDEEKIEDILKRIVSAAVMLAKTPAKPAVEMIPATDKAPALNPLSTPAADNGAFWQAAEHTGENDAEIGELEIVEDLDELEWIDELEPVGELEEAEELEELVEDMEEGDAFADDEFDDIAAVLPADEDADDDNDDAAAYKLEQDADIPSYTNEADIQPNTDAITNISTSIMREIKKTAQMERSEKEQREQKQAARMAQETNAKTRYVPSKDMPDVARILEQDTFAGIDSEETPATLNSDDFSYGSFTTKPSQPAPQNAASVSRTPVPSQPVAKTPPQARPVAKAPPAASADSAPQNTTPVSRTPVPSQPVAKTLPQTRPVAKAHQSASADSAPQNTTPVSRTPVPSQPMAKTPPQTRPVAKAHQSAASGVFIDQDGLISFEDSTESSLLKDTAPPPAVPPKDNALFAVESFDEVSEADIPKQKQAAVHVPLMMSFEDPHKGADINKVAMRIEFAPEKDTAWEHDFDIDMAIASPVDELFSDTALREPPVDSATPDSHDADNEVIKEYSGIPFIAAAGSKETDSNLDPAMKNLVDSVLAHEKK